jgi:Leucine Rich repeat
MATPAEVDTSTESPPVERYIPEGADHLDLGYVISDDGAVALAEELATNTSLKELYLADSTIGDDGAIALAGALATNKTLGVLWLDVTFPKCGGGRVEDFCEPPETLGTL